MKSTPLFRMAAVALAGFGVAHTVGMFAPSGVPPQLEPVIASMRDVRFTIMGAERTLWQFHSGLGLMLTAYALTLAWFSWQAGAEAGAGRRVGWGLAVSMTVMAALNWRFFFIAPAVATTLAAACAIRATMVAGRR